MIYRIRNWQQHFEHGDHRKTGRMHWVKLPNKHDGLGYRRLIKAGELHYACWVLMVQVASKAPVRGWLVDDSGRGLGPDDLELKTGMSAKRFEAALPIVVEVGWMEVVTDSEAYKIFGKIPDGIPKVPDGDGKVLATGQDRTGQEITGEKNTDSFEAKKIASKPPSPILLVFPCVGKRPEWPLTQEKTGEWRSLYPGLDILAECRKALAWIDANPSRRKTFTGMPGFLVRWFSRAIDSPCRRQDAAFVQHRRRDASSFADVGPDGEVPV